MGLKIFRNAVSVLGAPIGSSAPHVISLATEILKKYNILFELLLHEGLSNIGADHILRKCGVPSMNYLTRVVPPHFLQQASVDFNATALKTYKTKHNLDDSELDGTAYRQITLPVSMGGMGIKNHIDVKYFAYWVAVARALSYFQKIQKISSSSATFFPSPVSGYALSVKDT